MVGIFYFAASSYKQWLSTSPRWSQGKTVRRHSIFMFTGYNQLLSVARKHVQCEVRDGVAVVRLNTPGSKVCLHISHAQMSGHGKTA